MIASAALPQRAFADEPGFISLNPAQVAVDRVPVTRLVAMADQPTEPSETVTSRVEVEETEKVEQEKNPLTIAVSYYLLSDYVYRGVNYSEYWRFNSFSGRGEGREKPNHQITTSINWDFGTYGKLGLDTFFEWYAAQAQLRTLERGSNFQEYDFIIHWNRFFEPIQTDVYLGFQFYEFPHAAANLRLDKARGNNNDDRTQEWQFKLTHNDAWMWKFLFPDNAAGVLNPTFFFAQDVGIGAGSVWMELGISHPFRIPGVDNLTITPGLLLAMDGGYLKRVQGRPHPGHLRFAYQQLSLNITYDLTPLLHLPKWAGTVSVSGLLFFNDALGTAEIKHGRSTGQLEGGAIQDEFFGGMSVNWGWGG